MSETSGADEQKRIAELKKYAILDSLTEKEYEEITLMASLICNVPIALISLVDSDRQWFKSHRGLTVSETPRTQSFCAHAIVGNQEIMIVPDSRNDARFSRNPLVTGDPKIVFYAGVPLVNEAGYGLGTVCVIDTKPRELSADQISGLKALADRVIQLLKTRQENNELRRLKGKLEDRIEALDAFAMIVAHDIKSPLSSISLSAELLKDEYGEQLGPGGLGLLAISERAAAKIKNLVDGILTYSKSKAEMETGFGLSRCIESVKEVIVTKRKFDLIYNGPDAVVKMNQTQLEQILLNLISNSLRYNEKPLAIVKIEFSEDEEWYRFSVVDNGKGIAAGDQERIFKLFETASLRDESGISGTGIGLPTVKTIVRQNGGSISLSSEIGVGTDISFTIKKFQFS